MEKIDELMITDNSKLVLSKGEFRGINFHEEWVDQFLELVNKLR